MHEGNVYAADNTQFYFHIGWTVRHPDGRLTEYSEVRDVGGDFTAARTQHQHDMVGGWVTPEMATAWVGELRGYRTDVRPDGKTRRWADRDIEGHSGVDIRTIPHPPRPDDDRPDPALWADLADDLRAYVDDVRWGQINDTISYIAAAAGAKGGPLIRSYVSVCLSTGGGVGDPIPPEPDDWYDTDHADVPLTGPA